MDYTAIIEGTVKFRDGKKWKSRWCVVRKISPVADCLHLQLYRDSKDRYKQGQTKASLSLQHFLGVETGFTLDKESNTIAILCQDVTVVLAFDTRERLIQWQVKIANNLGEDQQYLIQVGAAPGRAKIAPGPARLHIQEYRFSLTMGVPPRLIGVWNISQLRKYGVVENRFVFEGGSGCGRYEGVYVLVTDQGEEISQAFRAASQGKLIPKRKQLSRNMSVMESPRKLQARLKSLVSTDLECSRHEPLWESSEVHSSDFGDTVSVSDLLLESQDSWNPQDLSRCRGCHTTKVGTMTRSLTVSNTPGTGFNPAWIMESTSCEHHIRNTICCNISFISHTCHGDTTSSKSASDDSGCSLDRSRAISPCGMSQTCTHQLEHSKAVKQPKQVPPEPIQYENYDTPRSLCINLKDDRAIGNRNSVASSGSELEYYDTPKKIKEAITSAPCQVCSVRCTSPPPAICHPSMPKLECSCHAVFVCPCQKLLCQPKPIVICPCTQDMKLRAAQVQAHHQHEMCPNGAIYAKVDMLKKTKRKLLDSAAEAHQSASSAETEALKETCRPLHYENLQFAQSLEHYENVRDLKVRIDPEPCEKCHCGNRKPEEGGEEDYLLMGPIPSGLEGSSSSTEKAPPPPYIPMNPIRTKCPCANATISEPVSTETRSATASPFLRRHDPSSCYLTEERRRIAQIRRRSNSMDSGRCIDGLECITERTVSSQNTLTANSASNSVDSLPSEKTEAPPKVPAVSKLRQLPSRRASSGPVSKSNRDSSSSNDSGVSTGSLKNFGAGFLEFETILTPLSKVRAKSLGATRELIKSKSSDPLEELTFKFNKADIKSSSAEAEVPICPPKKESKDLSVSSSSGALTIPYVDSISTSSGASDMSDYIETLSMSSFSSSEHDNLRQCHSAVTVLRPRSGKEYQKIDRINIDDGKHKLSMQHLDSPSPGYGSSTSSN